MKIKMICNTQKLYSRPTGTSQSDLVTCTYTIQDVFQGSIHLCFDTISSYGDVRIAVCLCRRSQSMVCASMVSMHNCSEDKRHI